MLFVMNSKAMKATLTAAPTSAISIDVRRFHRSTSTPANGEMSRPGIIAASSIIVNCVTEPVV